MLNQWSILFFVSLFSVRLLAQPAVTNASPAEVEPPSALVEFPPVELALSEPGSIAALNALLSSRGAKQAEIDAVVEKIKTANSSAAAELREQLSELQHQMKALNHQFESIATGLSMADYYGRKKQPFNIKNEIEQILEPMINELKAMTADKKAMSELRERKRYLDDRRELSSNALEHLTQLIEAQTDPELEEELKTMLIIWEQRLTQTNNQLTAIEFELMTMELNEESLVDTTRDFGDRFMRTRGMNILLGALAFCAVFFGMRGLAFVYRKIFPAKLKSTRRFTGRVLTLLFHLISVIGGLSAMTLVFSMRGDWTLMGFVLLAMVGVGWGAVQVLPQIYDQVRLVLNIGPVRERERLIFEGIPWLVEDLNFYTKLSNPALTGGEIFLPVRSLIDMHSRPLGEKEVWFPCREGDWVHLATEASRPTLGRVIMQSPDMVQVVKLGGSRETFQTLEFLLLNPVNLSSGFRAQVEFGIDYSHQAIATTEVPEKMIASLKETFEALYGAGPVQHVNVQLSEAGGSALQYHAFIDFDGSQAGDYEDILRLLPKVLVETCSREQWIIPFQQITLHQAQSKGQAG